MIKLSQAQGAILQTWQKEAAGEITESRDPVVAHRVIERVARTVARDIRVNLATEAGETSSSITEGPTSICIDLARQPTGDDISCIIARLDAVVFDDNTPTEVAHELAEIDQNKMDNLKVAEVLHGFFPYQTSELTHVLGWNSFVRLPEQVLDAKVLSRFFGEPCAISRGINRKVNDLMKALVTSEDFRIKALRAMRRIPMLPDKLLCAALVRQGMRTLLNVREPPDSSSPAKKSRKLIDKIDAGRCCGEFVGLDSYIAYAAEIIDAKEKEVAYRVFGVIDALCLGYKPEESLSRLESYAGGSPVYATAHSGDLTCFSSPWLQATLMMECGIPYQNMLFGKSNKIATRMLGGHGSIFLKTECKDLMWIDPAMHVIESDFDFVSGQNPQSVREMNALLDDDRTESVFLEFPEKLIKDREYPYEMQVMKLGAGLSSGHMLHTGISFLHEWKLAEAEYAFDLALSFNRLDPDVWYYLGLVNSLNGNLRGAEVCFKEAIQYFGEHLWSYFALGELAMAGGDVQSAKKYFRVVAKNECPIWGYGDFLVKARDYVKMNTRELRCFWKIRRFMA